MEACSGAHHWARQFRQYGHTVKLMAPKFVTPYRMSGKRGKNDAADAAAICEAVTRPNMRFVPVKEAHQQIILTLHRTRQGFVEERTAIHNRLRGPVSYTHLDVYKRQQPLQGCLVHLRLHQLGHSWDYAINRGAEKAELMI